MLLTTLSSALCAWLTATSDVLGVSHRRRAQQPYSLDILDAVFEAPHPVILRVAPPGRSELPGRLYRCPGEL